MNRSLSHDHELEFQGRLTCPSSRSGEEHRVQIPGFCKWNPILQQQQLDFSLIRIDEGPVATGYCSGCGCEAVMTQRVRTPARWLAQRHIWLGEVIIRLEQARRQLAGTGRADMVDLLCTRCSSRDLRFSCLWEYSALGQPEDSLIAHWDGPEGRCHGCGTTHVAVREEPISAHRALQMSSQADAQIARLIAARHQLSA